MSALDEQRLRAALDRLDAPLDLHRSYLDHRRLEDVYAARTASDEGVAALAAAAAVDLHARGEAADRAGDHEAARSLLAEAHRVGLPGADRRPEVRSWADADLDAVADAAATGDRAAVAGLLTRLRPLVARYCDHRLGRDPGRVQVDHADVVHEALMAVLVRLPDRAGRPVAAFAMDVTRRTVRDRPAPPRHAPELDAGLRALPLRLRNVMIARLALELSAEETAVLLRTTPGAVRVAQHRALVRLRARPTG